MAAPWPFLSYEEHERIERVSGDSVTGAKSNNGEETKRRVENVTPQSLTFTRRLYRLRQTNALHTACTLLAIAKYHMLVRSAHTCDERSDEH